MPILHEQPLFTGTTRFLFGYASLVLDEEGGEAVYFVRGGNTRNAYDGPIWETPAQAVRAARGLSAERKAKLLELAALGIFEREV